MTQENILLARQPIYDAELNVCAYELLFRPESFVQTPQITGDQATSLVVFNAFSEIGIYNVVGEHRAFINFTRNLILNPPPFTSNEMVIEVLENIQPDPEIIASLKKFKQQGYTIALDDFIYHTSLLPLVALADIIKIDVLALSQQEIAEHVALLQDQNVELLAEKVEDQAMYDYCKGLGFSYFQGFFLSRPSIMKGRGISPSKLVVMSLLADLQRPNITPQELHDTITRDPALSFKLLRLVNSTAYQRQNKVESLYRAILLIGLKDIRHWASMLALSSLDDKPHALTELVMSRAKMCEALGAKIDSQHSELFFTAGMLSMLDAYFDTPLETLLGTMSFTDEINDALIRQQGRLGFVLKTAIAYEQGRWSDIEWIKLSHYGLSIADVKQAYIDSLNTDVDTEASLGSSDTHA